MLSRRSTSDESGGRRPALSTRPWIGVRFACSGRYCRVFRDADGQTYNARCPSCTQVVRFSVGAGGSTERFYEVTCNGMWSGGGE